MDSLGIDIGGMSVKIAMTRDGAILWTGQSEQYDRPDTDQLVAALRDAAAGRSVNADQCGLCVPGLLDKSKRMITLAVNVPGVMNIPLDTLIHRAFPQAGPSGPGL